MNPYVVIKRHSYDKYCFLTVKVPELYSDASWRATPNHTPKFDNTNWYIKGSSHIKDRVIYPEQFVHLTLLEYMQTFYPEHLI